MASSALLVEKSHEGRVITLTLNRPEKRNAQNREIVSGLRAELEAIRMDPKLCVVVIRGAGDHFSAGNDISDFGNYRDDESNSGAAAFMLRRVHMLQDMSNLLERIDKVVVCVVDGNCIGGGLEMTMCADLVIATDRALFGIPEIDLDTTPGWGGTSRLCRFVGRRKVKEMVLMGNSIGAKEAKEYGLVNTVVPRNKLDAEVNRVIEILLSKRPMALKLMKVITTRGVETSLDAHLGFEMLSAMLCWTTSDQMPPLPVGAQEFVKKTGGWKLRRNLVSQYEKMKRQAAD